MKIMAIDYGDAHTGVAISDRTLTLTGFSTVITAYRPEAVIEKLLPLADRNLILERGRIAWQGSSAELDARRELWSRYLGV